MDRLTERKIVLVVRETRLEELKARFNTAGQARFYVEQAGGDFGDYEREYAAYRKATTHAHQILGLIGRVQEVHRRFLPNFVFGADDLVVAIGQDGLVANTLKYLDEQPLIGVNPEPARYDGLLLPFEVPDLAKIVPETMRAQRELKQVTMAKASLNNGQALYAVNDLFIGPKTHSSARYTLDHAGRAERQSSSGIIVSTGLGSTGWLASITTGATAVAAALTGRTPVSTEPARFAWDSQRLVFTVREPFPSRTTGTSIIFGHVVPDSPLRIESHMPERGVIFSDGIESDFLEFNSGTKAEIAIAEKTGRLVV